MVLQNASLVFFFLHGVSLGLVFLHGGVQAWKWMWADWFFLSAGRSHDVDLGSTTLSEIVRKLNSFSRILVVCLRIESIHFCWDKRTR